MTKADRKYRNQRTTVLTFSMMAEVVMGTAVLIWSTNPGAADGRCYEGRQAFGCQRDLIIVLGATVACATCMVTVSGAAPPSASTVHCGCITMLRPRTGVGETGR